MSRRKAAEAEGAQMLKASLERTGRLRRICMYCRREFGTTPCIPEMDGQESHGVCERPECVAALEADFQGVTK